MISGTTKVLLAGLVLTSMGLWGCEDPPKPKEEKVEVAAAKPMVSEGGACRSSEECRQGLACAPDNTCQTPKTIDCLGRTQSCKEEGRCYGKDNKCVPRSTEDCKKSTRCETDGKCTSNGDSCVAMSEADCKTLCEMYGRCTIQDGSCIAAKSSECRQSAACKSAKRCTAFAGRCVGR